MSKSVVGLFWLATKLAVSSTVQMLQLRNWTKLLAHQEGQNGQKMDICGQENWSPIFNFHVVPLSGGLSVERTIQAQAITTIKSHTRKTIILHVVGQYAYVQKRKTHNVFSCLRIVYLTTPKKASPPLIQIFKITSSSKHISILTQMTNLVTSEYKT